MVRRTNGIGAMRDRVTLEKPTQVTDDIGGQTVTWVAQATIFAYVKKERGGGRSMDAGRIDYSEGIEITLYLYDAPTIQRNWRVVYNNQPFTIEMMVTDDIDNVVYLTCKRYAN
jgi:SPP1 family predicted phage head-tail adaptor